MKKVFSLFVLIVALTGLVLVTVYALSHKGIREDVPTKLFKKVEKVTSNVANNKVADVFNVQVNGDRHKVKLEYNVTFDKKNKSEINLVVYIDGKVMFEEIISKGIKAKKIENLFLLEKVNEYIRVTEKDINIISDDKTEYIIINIGYFNEQGKRKYFVFTDRGTSLIDNGILIFDESIKYTTTDKKELDIYYTKDKNILAKQDKNDIYALEYKALEKNGVIEEYKYYIKKGKVEKDLINTYEGIKLVDNNSKK